MKRIYKNNGIYFITFRLADSLPQEKLNSLKEDFQNRIDKIKISDVKLRRNMIEHITIEIFGKYETQLDGNPYGSCILRDEKISEILYNTILQYHNSLYSVKCFSIMPNHVHILFGSLGNTAYIAKDNVSKWINLIKGRSARLINQYLGTSGILWAEGFWDRYIRNEHHYSNSYYYCINNPFHAGLSEKYKLKPYMWRKDRDGNQTQ